VYSSAGSKLSGLDACTIRLTFIFVCWGHALNQKEAPWPWRGHKPAWLGAEQAADAKGNCKSTSPTSSDLMPVRAQALGPMGVTAAGRENAWSECQLVGSLLRGFTTCKEMLPSCSFPLAIVMFMAAVHCLLQL